MAQTPPRIHFGPDETTIPTRKSYLFEIDTEPFSTVFYRDGRSATLEVESLVGKGWFQFPKNTDVLAELIELVTGPADVVLDFFAGSGSTGHAVMKVNQSQKSRRRYVLVQLPEPTGKDEYRTIADISRKRLAEAGRRFGAEAPEVDSGFRSFRLDSSNIRAWTPRPDDLTGTLLEHAEHLAPGRSEQDVLYELLLKLGLDLAVPTESRQIAGKTVHSIGAGALIACLSDGIGRDVAEPLALGIAAWQKAQAQALQGEDDNAKPVSTKLVFKDSAFADDVAKTNLAAILSQHGLDDVRSL